MASYPSSPDDVLNAVRQLNLITRQRGDEIQAKYCPYCYGGPNKDKFTFAINMTTGQYKCLRASCNAQGNMVTLANDFNISLGHDADIYYNIRPGHFRTLKKELKPEDSTPEAIAYLMNRGIPEEIIRQYRITTRKDHPEILVFPFYDPSNKLVFVKYRNPHPAEGQNKEWCEKDCKPILFGMDQCDMANNMLIMTEGQIDSLSVAAAGYKNAVSVPLGKNGFTWVPHCWDWLQSFKRLIIFGDNENGSITLLEPMKVRFHGQVLCVRSEDYRDCKDANDILRKYGIDGIKQCIENAALVPDPMIKPLWEVERKNMADLPHFQTGFRKLDEAIGGFFMGHLILITGERGNGKSTLGSQFAARALRSGHSIYLYSGEMPAHMVKQWLDRQLSAGNGLEQIDINGRIDYQLNLAQEQVINRYYKGRAYLYDGSSVQGQDEKEHILTAVQKAVTQYNCSVILIDNLMTAIDNPGPDLNVAQTQFVNRLTEIARTYNVCIFLLAHPRKQSGAGRELGNDDIMGSGNITNLASVVLSYTIPSERFGQGDRQISVLKNRLFGERLTGMDAIQTWFDPITKRISAVKGDFTWPDDIQQPIFTPIGEPDKELPF